MEMVRHLWEFRPVWLTPAAFILPSGLLDDFGERTPIFSCAYGVIVMAILWLTETLPIPVTALLPIFLFPMLGISTAKEMSASYISDTSILFLGGLIVAVALEETGLHNRISLAVMKLVGGEPLWLMLGLALTTWFLSMWISNTAATSMMVPIITAVMKTMEEINQTSSGERGIDNDGLQLDSITTIDSVGTDNSVKNNGRHYKVSDSRSTLPVHGSSLSPLEMERLGKGFALSVAYGANIGGIATLTGSPPNLILKNKADELYANMSGDPNRESPVSFSQWMGFGFPLSLIVVIMAWAWLSLFYLRKGCCRRMKPEMKAAVNETINKQFKALGKIRFNEIEILIVFTSLVLLWLFRAPSGIAGWGDLFPNGAVSDSTPCILLSVLLFLLPAGIPNLFCRHEAGTLPSYTPLVTWQTVNHKLPWGVIILLGGGFALAKACQQSGFSDFVGASLQSLSGQETWFMNLLICTIVAILTEMTSNTATAALLMPILASLAMTIQIHPLYLMLSATVACSFAFMLPVATPPNAIIFSTGYVTVFDMFVAGGPMNVIAILSLTFAVNTWGVAIFDLKTVPEFFLNATAASNSSSV